MGYRFELDHVAMPGVASIFTLLFILYEFCPSVLLFIPIGIFVVVYGTKNKRCDPRDVERFFAGFRVGGHRGAPHSFPENSLAGFAQAKRDGADLIEFDVAMTKDGKAVLLHDDDLDRTTNMIGPIRDKTLKELDNVNVAARFVRTKKGVLAEVIAEKIPTLEETVRWSVENDIRMLFDVKDTDTELVDIIAYLFEKYDLYDKAIVCSFYPWVVYRIKRGNQRILTGLTWRQKYFSFHDVENKRPRYTHLKQRLMEIIDYIHVFLLKTVTPWYLGADLLLTNNLDISQAFVDQQRRKGVKVAVWTVNDMAELHWMLHTLNIPILTDHPDYITKLNHLDKLSESEYDPIDKIVQFHVHSSEIEVN